MNGRKTFGIALVAAALGLASSASSASAAPVIYDFTGALTVGGSVHGSFTLDAATASVLAFSLTTPTGLVDAAHYQAHVIQYAPAVAPATSFVSLAFDGTNAAYDHLHLLFQTTLASFNGGNFYYASGVSDGTSIDSSSLICFAIGPVSCAPPAGLVFGGGFTTGSATAEVASDSNDAADATALAAVPEPTSLVLTGLGLLAFAACYRRRAFQSLARQTA